jgi:hypothetical protein
MTVICKSSAYQLSSRFAETWRPEYSRYYGRKLPRLLTAEEIHDSIVMATGIGASYSVYGSNERVAWAMQLRGPEEPANLEDDGLEAFSFFESFKRGDRFLTERTVNRLSVFQPLSLMHSWFVFRRIDAYGGGTLTTLLNSGITDAQLIDELFLSTVSRFPSLAERKLALISLRNNREQAAEDLLWALINKLDFMFVY